MRDRGRQVRIVVTAIDRLLPAPPARRSDLGSIASHRCRIAVHTTLGTGRSWTSRSFSVAIRRKRLTGTGAGEGDSGQDHGQVGARIARLLFLRSDGNVAASESAASTFGCQTAVDFTPLCKGARSSRHDHAARLSPSAPCESTRLAHDPRPT